MCVFHKKRHFMETERKGGKDRQTHVNTLFFSTATITFNDHTSENMAFSVIPQQSHVE